MASLVIYIILLIVGSKATGYLSFTISLSYVLHHAFIGYLFAAVFLCSEFSNHTFGMSLLCGYSRRKVFFSKILVFFSGLIILFLIYTGITTIVTSIGNGFGQVINWDMLLLLICGILGCAAMGAVIILMTVIAKKTIVTIGVGIGFTFALLWIETAFSDRLFYIKYTYSYQIGQILFWGQGFSVSMFVMVTLPTIIISLLASSIIFEKMELK